MDLFEPSFKTNNLQLVWIIVKVVEAGSGKLRNFRLRKSEGEIAKTRKLPHPASISSLIV